MENGKEFPWVLSCCLFMAAIGLSPEPTTRGMDFLGSESESALTPPFPLSLGYSTYLGGAGNDIAIRVAVDSAGSAYILGLTTSTNFPNGDLTSGKIQATFITKLSPDGDQVLYTKILPYCVGRGIAVNSQGQVIVVGSTDWIDFPVTTNAFQPKLIGGQDAFILALSTNGADVLYSTLFGGDGDDFAMDVAVNFGNVYVAGITSSTNFPVINAAQGQSGGDLDGFVLKFNLAGSQPVFSTYLGGSGADECFGLALEPDGTVAVTGRTISTNFPVLRPCQPSSRGGSDAFVAKYNSSGTKLSATYLGGSGSDSGSAIAMEPNGNMTVAGVTSSTNMPMTNAFQAQLSGSVNNFITRLSSNGSLFLFSTYFGGEISEGDLQIYEVPTGGLPLALTGLAVDTAGASYLVGTTGSGLSFPARHSLKLNPEAYATDAYAAKFDATGDLVFATLLGSSSEDHGHSLALDTNGDVFVTGITKFAYRPPNFPVTPGAFQPQLSGPFTNGYVPYDAFVTKLIQKPFPIQNDRFANRAMIPGTRFSTLSDNSLATKEPGEPNHAGNPGGKSLWWTWTPPADGGVWITTLGSSFESVLAVYSGSALSNLVPVASSDKFPGTTAQVKFKAKKGQSYHIAVDGKESASGQIALTLAFGQPSNDNFADALILQGLSVQTNGSNLEATTEEGENVSDGLSGRSVWYSWIAPTNGVFAVEVSEDFFSARVIVATGSSVDSLTTVAAQYYTPRVVFNAKLATTYYVRVDSMDGASGPFNLKIGLATPPPNDDFERRALLSGSLVITNGSNFNSTPQQNDPNLVNPFGIHYLRGSSIWWGWTAPTNGSIVLQALTTNFPPVLAVFTGSSLTNLTPIAAVDSTGNKAQLLVTNIIQGVQYQIMIDEQDWEKPGMAQLSLTVIMPPRFQFPATQSAPEFSVIAQGVIDRNYRVETSPDLSHWTPTTTLTATNGLFGFVDTNRTDRARFYRAVELPSP